MRRRGRGLDRHGGSTYDEVKGLFEGGEILLAGSEQASLRLFTGGEKEWLRRREKEKGREEKALTEGLCAGKMKDCGIVGSKYGKGEAKMKRWTGAELSQKSYTLM